MATPSPAPAAVGGEEPVPAAAVLHVLVLHDAWVARRLEPTPTTAIMIIATTATRRRCCDAQYDNDEARKAVMGR